MAITDPLIPSASSDLFAIFDAETSLQLFQSARTIKATINNDSKFMVHPRESGASQIDHKIDLPINMQVAIIAESANYRNLYTELDRAKTDATQLIVQTKTATHENMYIESIPREEDPAYFNTITMIIRITQALIFNPVVTGLDTANVAFPNDSSTVNRGQQAGVEATEDQSNQSSILFGIFN